MMKERAPDPVPAVEPEPPRPRRAKKAAAKDAETVDEQQLGEQEEDLDRKGAVPIYLPGPLFAQMKAAAAAAGETYSDWFLDVYARVEPVLADQFPTTAARAAVGLPPRKLVRRRVDTPTPVQLRLSQNELAVLEAKRNQIGSPSRSAFATAVVELGLRPAQP